MMADNLATTSQQSFVLKGNMLLVSTLYLLPDNLAQFEEELQAKIAINPSFFVDVPFIISCEHLTSDQADDLKNILQVCKKVKLKIMAVRCENPELIKVITKSRLILLPLAPTERLVDVDITPKIQTNSRCKIIETPIRSGMQVIAENCDLVVLSSVSTGAELVADGNILVYETLRGRVYAGNNGDSSARIFCRNLQAEFISIAGIYEVAENLRNLNLWGKQASITLQDGNHFKISSF